MERKEWEITRILLRLSLFLFYNSLLWLLWLRGQALLKTLRDNGDQMFDAMIGGCWFWFFFLKGTYIFVFCFDFFPFFWNIVGCWLLEDFVERWQKKEIGRRRKSVYYLQREERGAVWFFWRLEGGMERSQMAFSSKRARSTFYFFPPPHQYGLPVPGAPCAPCAPPPWPCAPPYACAAP